MTIVLIQSFSSIISFVNFFVCSVIGERFASSRASAAAQLANQRVYQGGLSSGISGAVDTASSVSSIPINVQPIV